MPALPLFITISPQAMAFILAVMAFFALLAVLSAVLPLLAVWVWLRGQRRRAALLAGLGLAAFLMTAGAPLWDRFQFARAVSAVKKAEITRAVPDLTGKVVAYMPARELDDLLLNCGVLLDFSGADVVYLLRPPAPPREWRRNPAQPLDLTAMVAGRAEWSDTPPYDPARPPDGTRFCVPHPLDGPMRQIDYFVIDGGFYSMTGLARDLLGATVSDDYRPVLGWYFAPVTDPENFFLTTGNADLLRFGLYGTAGRYPFGHLAADYLSWPPARRSDPQVPAALCRHDADPGDCHYE
ncbi:MAG: hypothetical protein Q4G25_14805 [Paracoccus sp. (in: a-proteobacteria)]|nr:hypothetical protein [Paracoccus sp. (in: a-proteobacteria)]